MLLFTLVLEWYRGHAKDVVSRKGIVSSTLTEGTFGSVLEWYTGWSQKSVLVRACGFESLQSYKVYNLLIINAL